MAPGNVQYVLFSTTTIVVPLRTVTVVPLSLSVSWIVPGTGATVVAVVACVVAVVASVVAGEVVTVVAVVVDVTVVDVVVVDVAIVADLPDPHPATSAKGANRASVRVGSRLITRYPTVPAHLSQSPCRDHAPLVR